MRSSQPPSQPNVLSVADEPHHHLVVDNNWVRAYAVEIGPRESTLCHLHSLPYLLYIAGDAEIVSVPRHGDPQKHHYPDTYCEFSPAGLEHVVENLADKPFRNFLFEVLPAAEKLHRPGPAFAHVAGVHISILYSGENISAHLIELSSGSQAQVTGAAIVGSVYEDKVEFISPDRGARRLQSFRELEYVPSGSTGLLRCESGDPVRVLVVTLGCE